MAAEPTPPRPIGARTISESAVLVTGSTAGIGYAIARAFLEAGAPAVMINGRNAKRADEAAKTLAAAFPGAKIQAATADAASPEGATAIVADTLNAFGRIDILVNSTGGDDVPGLFHTTDIANLTGLVTQGMMGPILASRAAIPHMMEKNAGCIINIASDAAKIATPGESVIGAVMAGIVMFTRGLAIEARRNGIRVNCITPSIVRGTPLYDRLMAAPFSGKLFAKAEQAARLGVVTPADIAPLVVFLASPAAAKLTGQAISVNGGISAA